MDQEIPDYDMDSEDEHWLNKQTKKMEVSPLKFENMMDRLEKGSGQTVSRRQRCHVSGSNLDSNSVTCPSILKTGR